MSIWRDRAREHIARLTKDLPADATLADRKKALWGKGYPAHGGTSWGRKMWGKEVRLYLARHGEQTVAISPRHTGFPDHIHFPFREQP